MASERAASGIGVVTVLGSASTSWPDELWAGSVSLFDSIIRTYYGVYEFTDDPGCVLRVGLSQARASLSLSDGMRVEYGELVGTLHWWNEHLPWYSPKGPDLGWACAMRDHVLHSLRSLAAYVESESAWREIRALRGDAALSARLGIWQVQRVVGRYGFERVPTEVSIPRRLHALGESFTLWSLTRAFNPAALGRQPFLREHPNCGFPERCFWGATAAVRGRLRPRPQTRRDVNAGLTLRHEHGGCSDSPAFTDDAAVSESTERPVAKCQSNGRRPSWFPNPLSRFRFPALGPP